MRKDSGELVFSPSDLVRYHQSPFASWMDRYYLENRDAIIPDEATEEDLLISRTGEQHEHAVLAELKSTFPGLAEISNDRAVDARVETIKAINSEAPIIYQAFLESGRFAGFADFLVRNPAGGYHVWDTKLARSPRPYFIIQLCCYSEMLAAATGIRLPEAFGIILGKAQQDEPSKKRPLKLGSMEQVEFRIEDFIHYYRHVKSNFLALQDSFTGNVADRPEPLPRADHGRWSSHAEEFFSGTDHLVQVAGISVGQIKRLKEHGIRTVSELAGSSGKSVNRIPESTLEKLASQARLQCQTRNDREVNPETPPRYEVLPTRDAYGAPIGLGSLPAAHPADVFFDIEGYPLAAGGLEYLFGASVWNGRTDSLEFRDWWAHDRDEEKRAFEGFVDWVFARWKKNPRLHIFHYAPYEVSAVRRLSTRHDTRQDEVDELLRKEVFVDLYNIIRHGLRIGEDSYSIKKVERLYRPKRSTEVATAVDSIVQYARWIENGEERDWHRSDILKGIRDYNEDDCRSLAELLAWLRNVATALGIATLRKPSRVPATSSRIMSPEDIRRQEVAAKLQKLGDPISIVLAHLLDFHRREAKPVWWRMFDRLQATAEELRADPSCIDSVTATGAPVKEKQSLVQCYSFDPTQECKLRAKNETSLMFTHNWEARFELHSIDLTAGTLGLKATREFLRKHFKGAFPKLGSLLPFEFVPPGEIPAALCDVAEGQLSHTLHPPVQALLKREPPAAQLQISGETSLMTAIRVASVMKGDCLVIQGPPGTGKTYTASHVIVSLLKAGRKVGVASNSHNAVVNLLAACGEAATQSGIVLQGIKVGGEPDVALLASNQGLQFVETSTDAFDAYDGGIVGGTAWLFSRPEWNGVLDFLFIDEAGQVPLANAVAMAQCARNLVLLGDQMQLEQPVLGSHPGDAGLSVLQYALKDENRSRTDLPAFHAVVPRDYGIFLGETRRMHPSVCRFISESIYEGRLSSHRDSSRQKISVPPGCICKESGIVFSGIEHDGNIQQSDEEVERVLSIYHELSGRQYTASDGSTRSLELIDFLFVAPYNAQVRALQAKLPPAARVGSVDRFQGQEAPVCILSLCTSYGEYGSRGLSFILDRNRINVAISRAKCLAVIVADPRIAGAAVGSIEEMTLVNLFCKVVNTSTPQIQTRP